MRKNSQSDWYHFHESMDLDRFTRNGLTLSTFLNLAPHPCYNKMLHPNEVSKDFERRWVQGEGERKTEIRTTIESSKKTPPVERCDKTRGVTCKRKAACNRAITSIQRVQAGNYSATAPVSSPGSLRACPSD